MFLKSLLFLFFESDLSFQKLVLNELEIESQTDFVILKCVQDKKRELQNVENLLKEELKYSGDFSSQKIEAILYVSKEIVFEAHECFEIEDEDYNYTTYFELQTIPFLDPSSGMGVFPIFYDYPFLASPFE